MPNFAVQELSKDDMDTWRREKKAYEESKSDRAWKEFLSTHYVKVCECGSSYSYPKEMKDPRACQACRGEEGELVY